MRLWLDSVDPTHPSASVSWAATEPDVVLRWQDGIGSLVSPHGGEALEGDPWACLKQVRSRYPGWWGGYLAYDLKNARDGLHSANPDRVGAPDLVFARFAQVERLPPGGSPRWVAGSYRAGPLRNRLRREAHIGAVREAQRRIREGDVYEVNLSHPLEADFEGDAYALYLDLRARAQVPFGAYMDDGDLRIACASPERFVSLVGGGLRSDPIKGTAPRSDEPEEDARLRSDLASSAKNRAENLMIVDLVRHDFSRVCEPGSVRVRDLFGIQTFRTVHQMVSTVTGQVRKGLATEDVLSACYPMGSMTGAPKIAAMRLIEELESWRRGIYSGAIGMMAPDGDAHFNVCIRTAVIRGGRIVYGTGGAVTSDSDPAQEWDETLVKARVLSGITGLEIVP